MTANTTATITTGRYLIAGGAGFLGSHLCENLLNRGASVVCVDNYITGRERNVRHLQKNSKFELVEHDITKPLNIEGGLAGVFNLASPASPIDYAKYPIETLKVGSLGAENMLNLAEQKKCPILVTSTSEVYGDPLEHPQKETYWGNVNPIGPRGCYDESKRYLEALTMAYHRTRGVKTRIVRIFNTYGPRMRTDDGRVVPNFCIQAIEGKPITIYGDGKQTRSFCYVDDLIEGIVRTFLLEHSEPINIGNPIEMNMLQFAEVIKKHAGSNVPLVFKPLPTDDPKTRCPDISKAKKMLNWEPKVLLADGLKKTYEYFQSVHQS